MEFSNPLTLRQELEHFWTWQSLAIQEENTFHVLLKWYEIKSLQSDENVHTTLTCYFFI